METVELKKVNVLAAYNKAADVVKQSLSDLFKGQIDFNMKITDRIDSVEAALAYKGKTLSDITSPNDTKDEAAYKVIKFVIGVLNEEWVANYDDSDQVKYEPRFIKRPGVGLAYSVYVIWFTATTVGVRLVYRDLPTLKHGVKILEKYYNDFLN